MDVEKEKMYLDMVKQDPFQIARIKGENQTEEMQLIVVEKEGDLLGMLHNPTAKVVLKAVETSPRAVKYAFTALKKKDLLGFYNTFQDDTSENYEETIKYVKECIKSYS